MFLVQIVQKANGRFKTYAHADGEGNYNRQIELQRKLDRLLVDSGYTISRGNEIDYGR